MHKLITLGGSLKAGRKKHFLFLMKKYLLWLFVLLGFGKARAQPMPGYMAPARITRNARFVSVK
jgi:hypothetical protein